MRSYAKFTSIRMRPCFSRHKSFKTVELVGVAKCTFEIIITISNNLTATLFTCHQLTSYTVPHWTALLRLTLLNYKEHL